MRPGARARGRRQVAVVRDERPAVLLQRLLDHRMAPALDDEIERAVDLGAHVVALDRERGERRRDIEHAERLARRA